jgi:thioesterase domain-containing protein
MLAAELERYLHEQIPLSSAMGVAVLAAAEDGVTLQAPLAPNINHRQTVFGGSASALALLAGWALLHVRLHSAGIDARLVIQRNTMEYQHPILGQFTARSMLEHPDRWQPFTAMLARRSKARITVIAVLEDKDRVAGRFSGEFGALR